MNRRIPLSVGAAAGGLLATAFLPVAIAFADTSTDVIGNAASTAPVDPAASTTPLGSTGAITPADSTTPLGSTGTVAPTDSTTPAGDTGTTTPVGDTGSGLGDTGTTPAGDTGSASDAFTLGNYTFDPVQADGSAGFSPVNSVFGASPFFEAGQASQTFDLTSGTGSSATDLGSISGNEDVSDLFGMHNASFTVDGANAASGVDASALPGDGSVFSVTDFGHGFENVYSDLVGSASSGNTITDTLVTPFGDFNVPTGFDATTALNPGDVFSGLDLSSVGSNATDAATGATSAATDAATGATDAATGAATGAADLAGTGADALGSAAGGAADAFDPLSLLGL